MEEKVAVPSEYRIASRLLELSACFAAEGRWLEGAEYLERMFPIASKLSNNERMLAAQTINRYAFGLNGLARPAQAERYRKAALLLQ